MTTSLANFLSPLSVSINDLLLDPNNPRFAELGDNKPISERRFAEKSVQEKAFEKMKEFDVAELRDTIRIIGFLPMDRLVVKEWKSESGDKKYIVIEGNRRLSALKWLLQLENEGKVELSEVFKNSISTIEVLKIDSENAPDNIYQILPGLRHVSGIKEWGPYQKAKAVHKLRTSGMEPSEAAQALGLSVRSANSLWRAYLALEQMSNNEEYSEFADPKLYSYFEELLKKPNLRDYFEWSDDYQGFSNKQKIAEFYSWIVVPDGDDENSIKKISEAQNIRELSKIIDDKAAMEVFRQPNGTLIRAMSRFDQSHPADWFPEVENVSRLLSLMSVPALKQLTDSEIETLNNLSSSISDLLLNREKLIAG
jgi:hypothetical protein